jgi:hypothetical protein
MCLTPPCLALLMLSPLQCADWKSARRWRLAAVDSGTLSFADLTFHSSSSSSSSEPPLLLGVPSGDRASDGSYKVTSVDESRLVNGHVVMLTWPPDGRYSPLHAGQPFLLLTRGSSGRSDGSSDGSSGSSEGVDVRALVAPLRLASPANSTTRELGVVYRSRACVLTLDGCAVQGCCCLFGCCW